MGFLRSELSRRYQRCQDVGQVVLGMLVFGQFHCRLGALLFGWQQVGAFIVQRLAVGLHVVEPNLVGATRVRLGEEQDGC